MKTSSVVSVGVLAVLFSASSARADTTCGSTPSGQAMWNAPAGATVLIAGPGPVQAVLNAVGEYRTHSMLSHGGNGWVTHSTSVTPPTTSDTSFCGSECANPVSGSFLHNSMPGLETVGQGAIYTFIYNDGAANQFIAYQNSSHISANFQTLLGGTVWSSSFSNAGYSFSDWSDNGNTVYGIAYGGTKVHYGWNQYMNLQRAAAGVPGADTGLVCSTSLAGWQHVMLSGQSGYTGDVTPRTYSTATITTAANALYSSVYSTCEAQAGFFSSFKSAATQVGLFALCSTCGAFCWWSSSDMGSYDGDPCDEAGDQIVNEFAQNLGSYGDDCNYDNEYSWHGYVGSHAASSISPDVIGGWISGMPYTGAGSSVWAYDTNNAVQWSSPGTAYTCWD